MIRLILMLVMLPVLACSQSNDLGFWEGTPEKLDGCKMYLVTSRVTDPVTPFSLNIVDCYGNEKRVGGYQADGSSYSVCSMETPIPSAGLLVQSITQTGWCTDPIGSVWPFWLDASPGLATSMVKLVEIYSSDASGANRNLLFTTSDVNTIIGMESSVTINDTYTSQGFYVLRVTARSYISPGSLRIYIRPGDGQVLIFTNFNHDETKELVFEKREFHIAI